MVPAAPVAGPSGPPIVRPAHTPVAESAAVRAAISQLVPGRVYVVRFRVPAGTGAGRGCDASASRRIVAATRVVRVALVPGGVWCAGAGVLRVAAGRGGATGASPVRVRPSAALGHGNVVGHLLLGPSCPVERVDDPCDPVAHPDALTITAVDAAGAATARTVTLADGSFALDLPPGSYVLHRDPPGVSPPSIADRPVVVTALATRSSPRRVVVRGDTGIR